MLGKLIDIEVLTDRLQEIGESSILLELFHLFGILQPHRMNT